MVPELPTGTITFLYTDIEGSTSLWERFPAAMGAALARHDAIIRGAVEAHNGRVVKTTGDGVLAVFTGPTEGVQAAVALQRGLFDAALLNDASPVSGPPAQLKVRAGLHTGEVELRDGDYFGPALTRAECVMSAGHGGQILLSGVTVRLASDALPPGTGLLDLGEHRLRGLTRPERIYQLVAEGLPADFPPLTVSGGAFVNLPAQPTVFVGRQREIGRVKELLASRQLVTLLGPGGTGKTRLAVQVATELAAARRPEYADGIAFVALAPLNDAESLVAAVAAALNFTLSHDRSSPQQQLLDYLRGKHLLLVLDNCEHLVTRGGTDLPAAILDAAPGVTLLATSRARLNIRGEQIVAVGGMDLPDEEDLMIWRATADWQEIEEEAEGYSAIRLFTSAARRVRPDFRPDAAMIDDIVRICRLVAGVPLAIELAAAWLELMDPHEIATEIGHSLDFLETELQGIPDRQRSIRAVYETSWQLLAPAEQAALPALSLFRGGFSREAAEAVGGATLRDLLGLANKSWLQAGPDGRYQMHELLRQYAEERLNRDPEARRAAQERHARAFARFLADTAARLDGPEQAAACDAISAEFENIRIAWRWLAAHGDFATLSGPMLISLWVYARIRYYDLTLRGLLSEAETAFESASDGAAGSESYLAILQAARLTLSYDQSGDLTGSGLRAIAELVTRFGPETPHRLAFWYIPLNELYGLWVDRDGAIRNLSALLADLPAGYDESAVAYARQMLARVLLWQTPTEDQLQEAERQINQALAIYERTGNLDARAQATMVLATVLARRGHYQEALALTLRAQPLAEAVGNWSMTWDILDARRYVYTQLGDIEKMFEVFEDLLAMSYHVGSFELQALTLAWDSIYSLRYADPERALRRRLEANALIDRVMDSDGQAWGALELGEVHRVRGDSGAAAAAYEQARGLFEQSGAVLGLGFVQRGLGELALARGECEAAHEHFHAYLATAEQAQSGWSRMQALCELARAGTGMGRLDEAFGYLARALRAAELVFWRELAVLTVAALAEWSLGAGRPQLSLALGSAAAAHPLTWVETRRWLDGVCDRARRGLSPAEAEAARLACSGDPDGLLELLRSLPTTVYVEWLREAETTIFDNAP